MHEMELKDFLKKNDLSMAEFAEQVGTTAATISRVADRLVTARRTLVERIYEATGGLVTPNDLAGLYCTEPCHHIAKPARGTQPESNDDGK